MDLFTTPGIMPNLLPYDGEAIFCGAVLSQPEAQQYFDLLMATIPWKNDEVVIYGKKIITKRKVAWFGDSDFSYTYSNVTRTALPWTAGLLELKMLAEAHSGTVFNSCLLNLYHSGEEGMSWHSDDEKELGENTVITSLSLGAARRFAFRHKITKEKAELVLGNGDLMIMQGSTQKHWQHSLLKSVKVKHPRINLTFRTFTF
ncbi:alpha-ketoglutarate-dependent dioxygenase AlkB [Flavobacterium cyanobacteriorum]|uniref:Alpha-ketoglutarate-dependent dioxygenase AlkB n=1 Tax=Flavobacterium cyanobacteriorum TaxID=2022802 RepID=A0A255YSB7_9FLAO|nr:alpha-ketoglutarate-dependent dioxygenase AlkB [Flavobacterium cyanobacteriorum]OYQ32087.1 alpha-ketoglutarate-dependent dioxygenase AlkB [Flavobacterium cyanobacteriorum]